MLKGTPPIVELDAATVEEAVAFMAEVERETARGPVPHSLPIDEQRAAMGRGAEPPHPAATNATVGNVPVRLLDPGPELARGTYLHVHGGGWTMGSNAWQDQRLWRIATEVGVRVVSVQYRLAPEHPFPANIDDCMAVAEQVVDGPTLIGGESAGAHLSAIVLTRMRRGFCGANLVYGCFDVGMTASQRQWGARHVILSTPAIQWHADQLLPGLTVEQRRSPEISPLFADLRGMPPALFTVGTEDPMLDDSIQMAAKWPGSTFDVYPGGCHAFDLFPLRMAAIANQRQIDFMRGCIDQALS